MKEAGFNPRVASGVASAITIVLFVVFASTWVSCSTIRSQWTETWCQVLDVTRGEYSTIIRTNTYSMYSVAWTVRYADVASGETLVGTIHGQYGEAASTMISDVRVVNGTYPCFFGSDNRNVEWQLPCSSDWDTIGLLTVVLAILSVPALAVIVYLLVK